MLNENLPGINGSDNRKIIKELYPDIKFLMISGNPEQLPIEDNGVFALEKPFSGNESLSKIQLINNELFK